MNRGDFAAGLHVLAWLGAIGVGSLWGTILVLIVFTPIGIVRARLEEAALADRFGQEWEMYTRVTYFMFPPIW